MPASSQAFVCPLGELSGISLSGAATELLRPTAAPLPPALGILVAAPAAEPPELLGRRAEARVGSLGLLLACLGNALLPACPHCLGDADDSLAAALLAAPLHPAHGPSL